MPVPAWSLYSLVIIILALAGGFLGYERRGLSSREAAVIATLASLAGLSRVPFAAVPGLQPVTFLVLLSGYVFGPGPGFLVGSLAPLVSNFFLGQGPWTPWQMAAWGLAGISGGWLGSLYGKKAFPRGILVIAAFFWGFLFGWILNTWHWLTFVYPLTSRSFFLVQLASTWFDLTHGVGNALFMALLGPELGRVLQRFKRRLVVSHLPVKRV